MRGDQRSGWKIIDSMEEKLIFINNILIKRNFVENLPSNHNLKERARALRKAGNYAEVVFWQHVHKNKFYEIDFDRQRIIGNYIVDFYIKSLGLVVEIDGESHNDKEEYDEKRELYLLNLGLKVFKTTNYRVLHDLENVLKELELYIIENYS